VRTRVDPSTRVVLEEAGAVGPARVGAGERFVELCARTSFSGITIEGFGAVEGRTTHDARAAWPGAGLPEEVVARAALLGQDTVAIADLDSVAGVVRAHVAGKELGVGVIPGCELLLDEGSLVLLPMTARGWANLCTILTIAKDGTLQRGVQKDDVEHRLQTVLDHHEDLQAIAWPPFADDALIALRDVFGDRLSVGLAIADTPDDEVAIAFVERAGRVHGIAAVLSARPLLVDEADGPLLDVLCCIRQHLQLRDAGQRLPPNRRSRMRDGNDLAAIARSAMVRDHPRDHPRDRGDDRGANDDRWIAAMIARSRAIADACVFRLDDLRSAFPVDVDDPDAELRSRTFAGAAERYPEGVPDDVRQQLEHELALVKDLGVAPYFLTVKDIVDVARDRGILCQGRGSAANSAVCYCLGITSIDPVRMGLLFERFLSRERAEPPDIDVDFEHERREEVIQEIYRRWGRDRAAMVCEVIAYRGRSAVREVGKVLGLSELVTGKIAELMHHGSLCELLGGRSAKTPQSFVDVCREVGIDGDDPMVQETLRLAMRLQGHPRHLGIHVGGFILTRAPLTTISPIEPARMEGRAILPFDKDDVDALGLFKMDVLGLGMLTCIRKAMALLEHDDSAVSAITKTPPPRPLRLHTIPAEDPKVYDAICRADTVGVFQIESRAQMAMLPRLRPRKFYDLVVEVALIRPGPIQGGMVHPYLRRRDGREAIDYPHESLKPVLERTLGVPLFQEQVMKLAVIGAGYTGGEADQLRRDMAAWKKTGRLERHRRRLFDGFTSRGVSPDFAHRLYEQIKGFGEYGFPESHAASFAILVYASSWLKTHHPAHFACALLNSLPMGFYLPAQIVADAQRHDVAVRPVCVLHSAWDCTLEPPSTATSSSTMPTLRLGLRLVKGLHEDVGRAIEAERQRGPFIDVADVVRRCRLDKRARLALAKGGAFDGLAGHRRSAMWLAMDPRPPLFARLPDEQPALFPPSSGEVLALDYATVGLSVSDHPMRHVRPGVEARLRARARGRRAPKLLHSREVQQARHGTRALVCGLVIGRQRPGTADGTCFVTLEDEFGMVNVVVWGRDFDRQRVVIVTSRFLLVDAVIEREGLVVHAIARAVMGVSPEAGTFEGGAPEAREAQMLFPFAGRNFH
jgi:error-prone DNA polymerase